MMDIHAGRKVFMRTGLAMLVYLVATLALQTGGALLGEGVQSSWLRYMLAFLPQYVIAMPLAYWVMAGLPQAKLPTRTLSAGRFAVTVLICFAVMYAGNLVGNIVNLLVSVMTGQELVGVFESLVKDIDFWVRLPLFVVVAPIAEELFFRKMMIPKLSVYGERPAVVVSALVFALIHGNLSQFFYALGLGLAFGYIFVKTGKVTYTIALHMLINLFGGVIALFIVEAGGVAQILYGMVMFGVFIAGIVLFAINARRIVMSRGLMELPDGKRAVYLNAGMLLFFAASTALFILNTVTMLQTSAAY